MPLSMKLVAAATFFAGEASAVLRGVSDHPGPLSLDAEVLSLGERQFTAYVAAQGRSYSRGSAEWKARYALYKKRVEEVERLNSLPGRTWTAGLNHFGDATEAELHSMLGYKHDKTIAFKRAQASRLQPPSAHVADECEDSTSDCLKDWSTEVTSLFMRNQGQCGSCWAVTASTVLDARSELHGTNRTFSTQNIVDCVPNPHNCGGSGGCDGATVELAFMYAMKNGLGCPEQYGAYTAMDGECDFVASESSTPSLDTLTGFALDADVHEASVGDKGLSYGLTGWQRLLTNRYAPLMLALQDGPVAVALAANNLFMYTSGIFNGCGDFVVNHAVTLIGYGKEGDKKFWLVQNSWGTNWGELGKIRIERTSDEDSVCGMDDEPQQGVACEGETDPVEVCGTCGILFDSIVPIFNKTKVSGDDDLC